MNRREFMQLGVWAFTAAAFRRILAVPDTTSPGVVAAAPLPDTRIPDPTPPQGQGMITIPFAVGRPRDEQVFIPAIRRN